MKVTFFTVTAPATKPEVLCHIATESFERRERLLIRVASQEALDYVDLLLWRSPPHSFLPHTISETTTAEYIAITTSQSNPNGASAIFNLTPYPLLDEGDGVGHIYEFDDQTTPARLEASKKAYRAYKEKGYALTLL